MSFSVFSQNPTVINDSLVVNQRLYAKEKLVVDQEAKFKQDVKVLGTARLQGDLVVDGVAKLNGNVKMEGIGTQTALAGDDKLIIILSNGQVKSLEVGALGDAIYEFLPCPPGDVAAPVWSNGLNKIFVACPPVNVGVGTSDPTFKLHVIGKTYTSTGFYAGNSSAPTDALYSGYAQGVSQDLMHLGTLNGTYGLNLRFKVTNSGAVEVYNGGTGNSLTIRNGSAHAIVAYSHSGAKILQLEDNGLLRAREVRIDATTWADFVFDEEYELPKLHDVAKYIELNHHLPGVPTSADIKENGINVAEIQTMQMQKIEELTLYMIEMNQRMDSLQVEVNRLKQENQELKKSGTK